VPKEGKSMARFTKYFANYLYGNTRMTHSERMSNLRRRISRLNKALNTVEVLQCADRWEEINPAATPTVARKKMAAAFMNQKLGENELRSQNPNRMICRDKFTAFLTNYIPKCNIYDNNNRYAFLRQIVEVSAHLNTYL